MAKFWTQIGPNIGELIKIALNLKAMCLTHLLKYNVPKQKIIIVYQVTHLIKKTVNLGPSKDEQTHFVAEKLDEPVEDDGMLSSLTQKYRKLEQCSPSDDNKNETFSQDFLRIIFK